MPVPPLFLGVILAAVATAGAADQHDTAVGSVRSNSRGWETPWEGRLPYIASISSIGGNQHICTGVLVDPWYVLTLSKCVEDSVFSAGKRPLVRLGLTHVAAKAEVHVVEKTFISEEVALLKLDYRSSQPHPRIHSDQTSLRDDQGNLVAVGWGSKMVALGQDIFSHLRVELTHYFSTDVCNKKGLWDGAVVQGHFCGFNAERRASCVVDSGAPLLLPHKGSDFLDVQGVQTMDFLVGINFDGAPCGEFAKPDEYVDVGQLQPWIVSTIREEARLQTATEGSEDQLNNSSGDIKQDDLARMRILFDMMTAKSPVHSLASDHFLGIVVAICAIVMVALHACGYNQRGVTKGAEVISNVMFQHSVDRRARHASAPTSLVHRAAPMWPPKRRQNSVPAGRGPGAVGSADFEEIEAAQPRFGIRPNTSPFVEERENMERKNKMSPFPFFTLDMEPSPLKVKMYVHKTLGQGSGGTVHQGLLPNSAGGTDLHVAIKKMAHAKLKAELHIAMLVCRDKHPNIIQILGAGLENGELQCAQSPAIQGYLVMEQMSHSLRAALEDPKVVLALSRSQALDILSGIASGLMHLHELNVVHQDVKPGNVLLALEFKRKRPGMEVQATKLNDFDLSGVYEDNQVTLTTRGTRGYMAPELLGQSEQGKGNGQALDMYALGVVIREVLGGSRDPLSKCCSKELLSSPQMQAIVELAERCTLSNPTLRPSAAEAFKVLDSVRSSPWCSDGGHLSRKFADLIRLLHIDISSYAGLKYEEWIKLLVVVARELHSQREAVAQLPADCNLAECLFVERAAETNVSHGYRVVFSPPEQTAIGPSQRSDPFQKPVVEIQPLEANTSAIAKLMDDLFLATDEEDPLLSENTQLPRELADLMKAVRTVEKGHTYAAVAEQLQAAYDQDGAWLIRKAVPCKRPSRAAGSGTV